MLNLSSLAETLSYILLGFFSPFIFQDHLWNWPFSRGNDLDYFFMMAALLQPGRCLIKIFITS